MLVLSKQESCVGALVGEITRSKAESLETGGPLVRLNTSKNYKRARRRRAPAFNRLPMLQQNRPRTMRPPQPPPARDERGRPDLVVLHFIGLDVAVGFQ